jgi:VanZ family protein
MTAAPRISLPMRGLAFAGAILVVIQVLFLAEPAFARQLIAATSDKLVHASVFGGLAFLLWAALGARWPLAVWLVVVLIGGFDEILQWFQPDRTTDVRDLLADAFGAGSSLIFFHFTASPVGEKPCAESSAPSPAVTSSPS